MTYKLAMIVAIAKRIFGWVIFISAILSTFISIIKFINVRDQNTHELYVVFKDFFQAFVEVLQQVTGFLHYFWQNSPTPTLGSGLSSNNVWFLIIYILIFVGLAISASAARLSRQLRKVSESVEDMTVLEQLKPEDERRSYSDMINQLRFPLHTFLLQIFWLYILPAAIAFMAYYLLAYLQSLGF
jgi:hypothetical protein